MPSVQVRQLVLRYGTVEALRGVSFALPQGHVLGLLGPNGAGKTSVMRVLVGLRRPASGRVAVLGCDVVAATAAVRRLVGYVPQAASADRSLTGWENVTLSARLAGLRGGRRKERVAQVLAEMGLDADAGTLAREYSGGMLRRLEIACALVGGPRVLLLDEPTLGLDPAARRAVWEHVHARRAHTGTSVLVTTHDMAQAAQHCDEVVVLDGGRVLASGTPAGLSAAQGPHATLEDAFVALTGRPVGPSPPNETGRPRAGRRHG